MTTAVCPGCAAADVATAHGRPQKVTHSLVLPGIHCAACMHGVETVLAALPGISDARVNLTRKRVAISATAGADPTPWIIALSKAGFEAHEADEDTPRQERDLLLPLGVAGFAMMNVMLLSVAVWSGAAETTREFLHWVTAAIALPATAFSAQPFFRNAFMALRAGRLNMDVPISLAIILASGMSLYEVIHGGAHAWFDAALALTFFLLVGRALDQRLRSAARSAADNLSALEPSRALRIDADRKTSCPLAEIRVGDRLWLAAGARVPVDGTLEGGSVTVDASFLTGESALVTRHPGQMLYAGEVAMTGPLTVQATRVGEDTRLRRIAQLVAAAEGARGRFRSLADRAAEIYTPAVHIISAFAFLGWWVSTGDVRTALNVAIATLIITCPCALGLAVPAMGVAATARLFRRGILVTSDTALERTATVDTVVFDKTGTLTERRLRVPDTLPVAHLSVLRALADASDHPLCHGLATTLKEVPAAQLDQVREDVGKGVFARVGATEVSLGSGVGTAAATIFTFGRESYALPCDETLLPDAAHAVAALKAMGLGVHMLTGDEQGAADRIATRLGMDRVRAEIQPEEKAAHVADLQEKGARVLMVGDGLNDTAALTRAHASIAPGSALDASRNAADMILMSGALTDIALAIRVCRTARARILQNFGLAVAYNSVSVPIAVLGFATPLAAALAMSTSSICVILNSIRKIRA
ncbi:MAG: heavy metal translocating P-type ATPase [Pseudomonadota bacterium]